MENQLFFDMYIQKQVLGIKGHCQNPEKSSKTKMGTIK